MTKLLIAVFFACASSARADGEECTFAVTVSSDRRAPWVTYINGHKGDTFSFQGANADCDGTGCFPLTGSGSVPYAGFCASTCIANGWGWGLNVLRNQNGEAVGHGNCCVEPNAVVSTTSTCKEATAVTCNGDAKGGAWTKGACVKQADGSVCAKTHDGYPQDDNWCYLSNKMSAAWCWCDTPDDDTQLLSTQLFLEEKGFLEGKSEVMSRTQGFVMMLFVSSVLSMRLGYVWSRGRRVATDPLPLLA